MQQVAIFCRCFLDVIVRIMYQKMILNAVASWRAWVLLLVLLHLLQHTTASITNNILVYPHSPRLVSFLALDAHESLIFDSWTNDTETCLLDNVRSRPRPQTRKLHAYTDQRSNRIKGMIKKIITSHKFLSDRSKKNCASIKRSFF